MIRWAGRHAITALSLIVLNTLGVILSRTYKARL